MKSHAPAQQQAELRSAGPITQREATQATPLIDNRPASLMQRRLQDMANHSPRAMQLQALQQGMNNSPQSLQMQARAEVMQAARTGKPGGAQFTSATKPAIKPIPQPVVQRVIHKRKTATSEAYVNAPRITNMTPEQVRAYIKSEKHYVIHRSTNTLVEVKAPGAAKQVTPFVAAHERKSRAARREALSISKDSLTRIAGIFKTSKTILKKAKITKGNHVFILNRKLRSIYKSDIDSTSASKFYTNFQLGGVNFSIRIADQSNIKSFKDMLAVTHVSLKGTGGKSSYASIVETSGYPTLQGNSPHFKFLYALEALRNPQFIAALMLKNDQVHNGNITGVDAIDPTKYGTHELIGAAGQSRDELANQRTNSTARLVDAIDDNDGLKDQLLNKPQEFEDVCKKTCLIM